VKNPPITNDSSGTPSAQTQGITEIRQKNIAALLARGFSVKDVAKKLKMSESRIYHLLSDKDSLVNAEINRILNESFCAGDRRLISLYDKALEKLDSMLSSFDEEKQIRAIDRITKIYLSRSTKNWVTIQQYFGIAPPEEDDGRPKSIEELILQMRKERRLPVLPDNYLRNAISQVRKIRGLPELPDHDIQDIISKVEQGMPDPPDHTDSSHPTPEASSHSSTENSTQGNPPQHPSSQHAPSQGTPSQEVLSPGVPSPNAPSPNNSSQESIEEFVESMGLNESTT